MKYIFWIETISAFSFENHMPLHMVFELILNVFRFLSIRFRLNVFGNFLLIYYWILAPNSIFLEWIRGASDQEVPRGRLYSRGRLNGLGAAGYLADASLRGWLKIKRYCKAKKRPFEMTFCCAEKTFKLVAQKCDYIWRNVWRCFVGKGTRHPKSTVIFYRQTVNFH